jgi:hypothetical protein
MRSETQNGLYLIPCETIKHVDDLVDRKAIFQILEDRRNRYARSAKHPGATDLSRYALDRSTLRPIQGHSQASSRLNPSQAASRPQVGGFSVRLFPFLAA